VDHQTFLEGVEPFLPLGGRFPYPSCIGSGSSLFSSSDVIGGWGGGGDEGGVRESSL